MFALYPQRLIGGENRGTPGGEEPPSKEAILSIRTSHVIPIQSLDDEET